MAKTASEQEIMFKNGFIRPCYGASEIEVPVLIGLAFTMLAL